MKGRQQQHNWCQYSFFNFCEMVKSQIWIWFGLCCVWMLQILDTTQMLRQKKRKYQNTHRVLEICHMTCKTTTSSLSVHLEWYFLKISHFWDKDKTSLWDERCVHFRVNSMHLSPNAVYCVAENHFFPQSTFWWRNPGQLPGTSVCHRASKRARRTS